MANSTAIDKLKKKGIGKICELIIGGETMTSISKGIGVNVCSMHEWIAKDPKRSVRAREARVLSARSWDDLAESGIRDAKDSFELSKAKEIAYHYRWRASKIAPKDYGDKLAIGGDKDNPLQSALIVELSDNQLDSRINRLMNVSKKS